MSANWSNRTIWPGDNLPIMRGMNSDSVDLIYLDPPFNSKANYAAPIGSEAAGAEFKDTWTLQDVDISWLDLIEAKHPRLNKVIHAAMSKSDKSYLIYLAVRLLEMHRLFKPTLSIYLHCDPTMSQYLKLLLDAIFGRKNFRNEIVWCFSRPSAPNQRHLSRVHDIILSSISSTWTFNANSIRQECASSSKSREGYSGNASKIVDGTVQLDKGGKFSESGTYIRVHKGNSKKATTPLRNLSHCCVVKATFNEEDVVFDPFCGCATTLVAADRLQRKWTEIDVSNVAVSLVEDRITANQGLFQEIQSRTDVPQRTDVGVLLMYNSPNNTRA